jgi:type 2 lantibiotic biosynthesis protein LanM
MDIPKFTALGNRDSITLMSGETLQKCFTRSPLHEVKNKIERFNSEDLDWQVELIHGSMDARIGSNISAAPQAEAEKQPETDNIPLLDQKEMIKQALILAEELRNKAYYSKNGEPSWVVLKSVPDSEQFMVDSMDYSLYDGRCGVAFFLAALDKFIPGSEYRDMAYSTMAIVRRWLKKGKSRDVSFVGIGGFAGMGSMIYSLVRLGDLLNDPELYEEAKHAALLLNLDHINNDKTFDIIAGSAGTILGLLTCYHANGGNGKILDMAVYCGNHLLKNRSTTKSGFKAWNTMDNIPLLGFSHGAAGIAYALLKLYQATGNKEFYDTAKEAIEYETAEFNTEKNNWPDFRVDPTMKDAKEKSEPGFMCAWCHGASGIGLARIGTLDILESDTIKNHIQVAMETTIKYAHQLRDHLCCGNMGRSEALLTAGIKLSQPKLVEEAIKLTSNTTYRANKNGSFSLSFKHGFYSPGMFQGAAGVGYHLLRLTQKESLPAVLLLE